MGCGGGISSWYGYDAGKAVAERDWIVFGVYNVNFFLILFLFFSWTGVMRDVWGVVFGGNTLFGGVI